MIDNRYLSKSGLRGSLACEVAVRSEQTSCFFDAPPSTVQDLRLLRRTSSMNARARLRDARASSWMRLRRRDIVLDPERAWHRASLVQATTNKGSRGF